MFKSTYFRRLYLPYLLLICVVAWVVGLLGVLRLRESFYQQRKQDLSNTLLLTSRLLADPLRQNDPTDLQKQVDEIGRVLDCRLTIITADPQGKVLADNEAQPAKMESHRLRPEVITAMAGGEGWDIRTSDTLHEPFLYHARQVTIEGYGPVCIRLAVHVRQLDLILWNFYTAIGMAAVVAMAGAAVASYYLARYHAIPIVQITRFANALADGRLEHRILRIPQGELGSLSRSLNSMADSLARLLTDSEKDKAELQTILAGMSEGVIAIDAHRHILLANESAGRLLGFDFKTAQGKLLWEAVRQDQIIRSLDQVITTGVQTRFHTGPLAGIHLEITICPFTPTQSPDHARGCIIVAHDITQSFRYQELRKEFVANVSHELRTPLSVIKGFVETLRDGAAQDPVKCNEYLQTIERHAHQLGNLVDDLLNISRLESQASLPNCVSLDLAALTSRVAQTFRPAASARNHTLDLELPPVPVMAVGNADYLERAVANLLENAVKYTPPSGRITLRVRGETANAVIEVADNGIGIPQADLPRIFERFYRVDRSRSREMGGTGLGLAIVKHIVSAHNGRVEVTSQLDAGSTFRIYLPLKTE